MKYCPACGTKNMDDSMFCEKCGKQLNPTPGMIDEVKEVPVAEPKTVSEPPQQIIKIAKVDNETEQQLRKIFNIPKSETIITSVGNSFLQNLINSGTISQSVACVTQNRLYYQGHTFSGKKKAREVSNGSVPLKDISYSGIVHFDPLLWKVLAFIIMGLCCMYLVSAIPIIISTFHRSISQALIQIAIIPTVLVGVGWAAWHFLYIKKKVTAFKIDFPGSGLAFDMKYYSQAEMSSFRDVITVWVDHAKGIG